MTGPAVSSVARPGAAGWAAGAMVLALGVALAGAAGDDGRAPAPAPAPAPADAPAAKKLVEYGWDVPDPGFLRDHLRRMEELPFDGVIFRLRQYNHAFDPRPWPAAELAAQTATLQRLRWERFTDNFLCLYAANRWGMDWFDDRQWEAIQANLRTSAAVARLAGCVGICFDPEPYGPNPWTVPLDIGAEDFERLAAQVRRRGEQFAIALRGELPEVKLLLLYGHSVFGDLAGEPDPQRRQQQLIGHHYALYLPFLDGLLDGLRTGGRLIDGNEPAYYYQDSAAFFRAFHAMRQENQALVAPENREVYRLRADAGMALYVDQVLGLRQPAGRFLATYMEPGDRRRWFEHNVYWALRTTDEYVWCYSERMNWWTGDFPEGLDEAIRAARARLAGPRAADFQLTDALARGRAAMDAALAAQLVRRQAVVPVLAAGTAPPVIDGALADPCWAAGALPPLLPPVGSDSLVAGTAAWAAADDTALYVAVRCEEPAMDKVVAAGSRRDDALWLGDTVELFVSLGPEPEPYVHLIVNPDNVRWDGISGGPNGDSTWDGAWSSAVGREAAAWCVEMAVPWTALGGRPQAQESRRANICRQRLAGNELSAWSMVVQGFLEPAHFGVWQFGGQR